MGSLVLFACAVCGAGQDNSDQGAYIVMTIIMSLLPLAVIGGVVFWLAKSAKAHDAAAAVAVAVAKPHDAK